MYPYIEFDIIKIPTYLLLFFIAFAVMIVCARKLGEKYNYPKSDILYISFYGLVGMYIGAKLMYFVSKLPQIIPNLSQYIEYWKSNPLGAFEYSFGGLVFYGGLIGMIAGAYIYCRKHTMPFTPLMDIYAPLIPFVHGVGRIGCFMAGCCYGKEYHGFGSVQFPENELIPELDDVPRVPVQLLEAGLNFIIAIVLYLLLRKGKMKAGQLMGIYIVYYTVIRYLMEMLRGDEVRGSVGGISTSQLISVILLPVGIVLLRGRWLERKLENQNAYVKDIEGDENAE